LFHTGGTVAHRSLLAEYSTAHRRIQAQHAAPAVPIEQVQTRAHSTPSLAHAPSTRIIGLCRSQSQLAHR
jgi:hypothetical protein